MKEMIEDKYPLILVVNPFYYYVTIYQDIFLFSKKPSINDLIILVIISLITLSISTYLYNKMLGTIKDII